MNEDALSDPPRHGEGDHEVVEGYARMIPTSRRQGHRPVPLHHPADGLPPPVGEERHVEIFATGGDASGAALALALARDALKAAGGDALAEKEDRRAILWVQDRAALRLGGRPFLHGLPGDLRHRLIHVEARTPEDALFALEEGLRCRDLAFVLGEIAGNPRALDFTASRRLSLAAEKHGAVLWLVRLDARADLSSARMRWRVAPAPSPPPHWDHAAPGPAAWRAELFRARAHPPGEWILTLRDPLPRRGRRYEDLRILSLSKDSPVEVGEGGFAFDASSIPLQAAPAPDGASCAILSPRGERANA